ncbi:Bro-N domain-containing protein [Pseudomonas bubulae]|uniref:BRO-N domain-containing protein n=1 Tax=Pseudomonas bubulae TaxID=2316085 RepID=UPI00102F829E|nr:BRO family protein [Pseudomonas bubulae]
MGIELDVLVGHPEHDLLFVATQVARAAGLKQPANSASAFRRVHKAGQALMALIQDGCIRLEDIPADERHQRLRTTTVIFTESESYQMLLRGSAPQSEPFRKWVTEEVLPTIRKTGSYNAEESTNPIAMGPFGAMNTGWR